MQKEEAINLYLQAGYRIFPLAGKKPISKGWQNVRQNPFIDPKSFTKNYGVVLQTDDLVIDIDVSEKENGTRKKGRESFNHLVKEIDLDIQKTFVVKTGSGGFHIYLKKPKNVVIKEKWRAYPDLEFKSKNPITGKGSYVVGAESTHPGTHKNYIIVMGSPGEVLNAPEKLLEIIKSTPTTFETLQELKKYSDDNQTIDRTRKFLEKADIAVAGNSGDKQTYIIACRCRSFGLSPQVTYDLMQKYWNPRCEPEWENDELRMKIYNAYTYDTVPQGHRHPESDFKSIDTEGPTDNDYVWGPRYKNGLPKSQIQNTVVYFNMLLPGLLKYNLFTDDIEFTESPPWYPPDKTLVPWTDNDSVFVKHLFAEKQKYDINVQGIQEGALIVANKQQYHPLKDYLNNLVWDRKERINNWLHTYTGVKNDLYSQTIGVKTLLGAVARIFEPGCKFDTVLILEGDQGIGKSRLIEAMGKDWYGDLHLDPHNKDTVATMRNKWIIEISEMTCIKRSDINAMRSFLSRATDRHRLSHRRNAEDYPRQCIFIGTINPDAIGYLTDPTGNRRFWPVAIPEGFKIKVDRMIKDVDQIWAEAVYKYRHEAVELFLSDEKIVTMAKKEAEKRRPVDDWQELIRKWLNKPDVEGKYRNHVTSMQIWTDCLDGVPRNITKVDQIRITGIMQELKWKKGSFTNNGTAKFGYSRPKTDIGILK